jgi:hypothetical protein
VTETGKVIGDIGRNTGFTTPEGTMKRLLLPGFAVLLTACTESPTGSERALPSPSFASAHFIDSQLKAAGPNTAGALVVNFKIAGLGDNVTTTVTALADADALYACRNNGGNFPSDPKKQQLSEEVDHSDDFTSGKNGQITGSLSLSPPASTLECPAGQRAVLVSVSYTNVRVNEDTAGTETIDGTFSRTFFSL